MDDSEEAEQEMTLEEEIREREADAQEYREFGGIAIMAIFPLFFAFLFLSLLGLRSSLWFAGVFSLSVLAFKLYPHFLLWRARRPLRFQGSQTATGKEKRKWLVIAMIVTIAIFLVQILGTELRNQDW